MQLYLNYKHRAFVFTQEMLVAMDRPAYVEMWNDRESKLLFVPRGSRSKAGACFHIPEKVYEDGTSYAVGFRAPFVLKLVEIIGKDVPAVVLVTCLNTEDIPDEAFHRDGNQRKPSGIAVEADLNEMETFFFTDELERVYDQGTQGRFLLVGEDHVFAGSLT